MTQGTELRKPIVTWLIAALAVGLAIGWYVDRSALERRALSAVAAAETLKEKTKQAILTRAGAEKELKLTKQALFDADETRVLIGKKLSDCESRERDALNKLNELEKR